METGQLCLKVLVLYLDDFSKKAISWNSQVRAQFKKIKFLNENVRMPNQTLKLWHWIEKRQCACEW